MGGQVRAESRRLYDFRFADRWFVGKGLDVCCGDDPIRPWLWPRITALGLYDIQLGSKDALTLQEVEDASFDFIHSSHGFEHMVDLDIALENWLRVIRPGGFIVMLVPEELLYECGNWPSKFNEDHKYAFTLRQKPVISTATNLLRFLNSKPVDVELISLLTTYWNSNAFGYDQTLIRGGPECSIEVVLRKPIPSSDIKDLI